MPHVSLPAQLKPQEFLPLPSGFGAGPGSLTQDPFVQYVHPPGLLIQLLPLQSLPLRLIKRKPTDVFLLPGLWTHCEVSTVSTCNREAARPWDMGCDSVTSRPFWIAIITLPVAALALTGLGAESISQNFLPSCNYQEQLQLFTSVS